MNTVVEQAQRHSLFQLLRRLEREDPQALEQRVAVRPALALHYPMAEVVALECEPGEQCELVTSLPGLYGVGSPLPTFYTEELLAAEQEDRSAARGLLDILHRRLYLQRYRVEQKYQPLFPTVEQHDTRFIDLLESLAGTRELTAREGFSQPEGLLRYIALFNQRPRNAMGLQTLLRDALPGIPVRVEQCIERRVPIPVKQRLGLGLQGNRLGSDSVLGQQVVDISGRLRVLFGPLSAEQFHNLLDEDRAWPQVRFLILHYLDAPLEVEVAWYLAQGEAEPVQPGADRWSSLGRDTWLGADAKLHPQGHLFLNRHITS